MWLSAFRLLQSPRNARPSCRPAPQLSSSSSERRCLAAETLAAAVGGPPSARSAASFAAPGEDAAWPPPAPPAAPLLDAAACGSLLVPALAQLAKDRVEAVREAAARALAAVAPRLPLGPRLWAPVEGALVALAADGHERVAAAAVGELAPALLAWQCGAVGRAGRGAAGRLGYTRVACAQALGRSKEASPPCSAGWVARAEQEPLASVPAAAAPSSSSTAVEPPEEELLVASALPRVLAAAAEHGRRLAEALQRPPGAPGPAGWSSSGRPGTEPGGPAAASAARPLSQLLALFTALSPGLRAVAVRGREGGARAGCAAGELTRAGHTRRARVPHPGAWAWQIAGRCCRRSSPTLAPPQLHWRPAWAPAPACASHSARALLRPPPPHAAPPQRPRHLRTGSSGSPLQPPGPALGIRTAGGGGSILAGLQPHEASAGQDGSPGHRRTASHPALHAAGTHANGRLGGGVGVLAAGGEGGDGEEVAQLRAALWGAGGAGRRGDGRGEQRALSAVLSDEDDGGGSGSGASEGGEEAEAAEEEAAWAEAQCLVAWAGSAQHAEWRAVEWAVAVRAPL
jgi:hypothetical protein